MERPFRAFVGIDWATETHQIHVQAADGNDLGERAVPHSGVGLADLVSWLREIGEPSEIAVAIEVPHGAVVETLLEQGFAVFAINPKQLDRFRDRFSPAGAKDDRLDAMVLASALRTDRHCFRALKVDDPLVIELREWSRMIDELQRERNGLTNRVREQLRRYFPQALSITSDPGAPWFLALLDKIPTPSAAHKVRPAQVAQLLKQHRIRKVDAATVITALRSPSVTVAPGTEAAATAHLGVLAPRLLLIHEQIKTCTTRLDRLLAAMAEEEKPGHEGEQRDVKILRSLPGVGRIVLATLLAEAAQPLRRREYHALRTLSGVAPVTRRSGKRTIVIMRNACHGRMRNAVYHWSRTAVQNDPVSRAAYASLRARGHSHGRALRTIGDRLLAVACAMLRAQTDYDPALRRPAA